MTIQAVVETSKGPIELNFPDGTSREVIQRTVQRFLQEQSGQPPQVAESRPADLDPDISLRQSLGLPHDTGQFQGRATGAPTEQAIARNRQNQFPDFLTSSPTLQAGGALIGGLVGSPGGPPGIAIGSTLGAMGGEALKGGIEKRPVLETAEDMATAGAWELGGYGLAKGIPVAFNWLKDKSIQKSLGMSQEEAIDWILKSGRQGVPTGAVDISQKSWPRGFRNVFGRFPLLTKFPSGQKARVQALVQRQAELLDSVAPVATANEIGIDIAKNSKRTSKQLQRYYRLLYTDADKLAGRAGDVVPTDHLKNLVKKLDAEYGRPSLEKQVTKTIPGSTVLDEYGRPLIAETTETVTKKSGMAGPKGEDVRRFIAQFDHLGDYISIKQLRAIQKDLNRFYDQAGVKGFDKKQLGAAKDATEKAVLDLDNWDFSKVAPEVADAIMSRYRYANRIFMGTQKVIGGSRKSPNPVADAILRTGDEGIEGGRLAGTLNPDELAELAFKAKSPEAIRQLRTLAGDDVVKLLARRHLAQSIKNATQSSKTTFGKSVIKIDPDKLLENLGLSDASKASLDALQEMLRGTGTNVKDLKEFAQILSTFDEMVLPSQFVARRAVLGGLGSLKGATGIGAIMTQDPSLVVGVGLLLATRGASNWLTNPEALKYATKFLRRDPTDPGYAQAALRMLRLAAGQGTSAEEPKGVNVRQKLTSY